MSDFSYGIITVSDRCYKKESKDESGPLIDNLLKTTFKATKITQALVPDEQDEIEKLLKHYSDDLRLQCIFTTGGSGFSPRDTTPEATKNVITKECSQLAQIMLLEGLKKTPFAALTRSICGIRNRTLIINFPGSKKAVAESFEAIKSLIPHAIELICDEKSKTEAVHKELQKSPESATSGVSSDEDPVAQYIRSLKDESQNQKSEVSELLEISSRSSVMEELFIDDTFATPPKKHCCPHKTAKSDDIFDRNSKFPMIEVDTALKLVFENIQIITKPSQFHSPINCPPFRASIKDGYAVKSSTSKVLKVIGFINAGDKITQSDFNHDECFKINTGAAVPTFADAILQVEDTKLIKSSEDGIEQEIEVLKMPKIDQDIRKVGSDIAQNQLLFTTNGLMDVAEKTLLAAVGIKASQRKPKIAIISTGDELVDPSKGEIQEGKIFDSNTTMLVLLCQKYGFDVKMTKIAKDDYESLKDVVVEAMESCDVIVSSGGVSMGDKDFVKKLLVDLGYEIKFGRVNMKPGKPMTFACTQSSSFFALPGNPVSAFVCFHIFVLPALRFMSGFPEAKCILPTIHVIIQDTKYELDERPEYVRATVSYNKKISQFNATITENQISSRIASLINADVLVHLPSSKSSKVPIIVKGCKLKATVIDPFFISSFIE